jgi:hypothetical protein
MAELDLMVNVAVRPFEDGRQCLLSGDRNREIYSPDAQLDTIAEATNRLARWS